jgi:hypothetical protein
VVSVRWEQAFAVLVVSHLVGDYLFQTEWQARNKRFGLGSDPVARRALFTHVLVYTLCFVPAIIWIETETSALAFGLAAVIFIPHLLQDDSRLLSAWNRRVKHGAIEPGDPVYMAIDQSFHVLFLFGTALLAAA